MIHWSWLIMAFVGGGFIGMGIVFVPLLLRGFKKLEKR